MQKLFTKRNLLYFVVLSAVFLIGSYLLFGLPGVIADIINPVTPP